MVLSVKFEFEEVWRKIPGPDSPVVVIVLSVKLEFEEVERRIPYPLVPFVDMLLFVRVFEFELS